MCKVLTTVGQILDIPKARAHMDVYFSRMKQLTKSPNAIRVCISCCMFVAVYSMSDSGFANERTSRMSLKRAQVDSPEPEGRAYDDRCPSRSGTCSKLA